MRRPSQRLLDLRALVTRAFGRFVATLVVMTPRKILCPIDFSAGSEQALRVAVRLAKHSDAELVIAHSHYIPPAAFAGEFAFPATALEEVVDDARKGLAAAAHEAAALHAGPVTTKLLSGTPWHAIVELLQDPSFDLVVIGTHGRTGLSRILLGSVAEKVVRHAPCSVLAVRPDGEVRAFDHVLYATDFSDSSDHALPLAKQLAKTDRARVTLLHVVELPITYFEEPLTIEPARGLEARAAQALDKLAGDVASGGTIEVKTRTRIGRPAAELLATLDEDRSIDLVVLGSHGRTGIKRVLLGSVAEQVVRHAPCPVLVVRKR